MIYLDKDTKCLVQGITGKQGSFHTEQMLEYNTNIVAGVTPGKGGQDFMGVPIFNSIAEAKENCEINASIIFVPAKFAKDAAFESIRNLDLVVIISEHIPVHDALRTRRRFPIPAPGGSAAQTGERSHRRTALRQHAAVSAGIGLRSCGCRSGTGFSVRESRSGHPRSRRHSHTKFRLVSSCGFRPQHQSDLQRTDKAEKQRHPVR